MVSRSMSFSVIYMQCSYFICRIEHIQNTLSRIKNHVINLCEQKVALSRKTFFNYFDISYFQQFLQSLKTEFVLYMSDRICQTEEMHMRIKRCANKMMLVISIWDSLVNRAGGLC